MIIAANSNHPPFGLFVMVHLSGEVRCLCSWDLRVLLDHCGGLGGDFWLGRVEGRGRSEGERFNGPQIKAP